MPKRGERLADARNEWRKLKDTPQVMELITLREKVDFINEIGTGGPKKNYNSRSSPEKMKPIEAETKSLVDKGVISEITAEKARKVPGLLQYGNSSKERSKET